MRSLGWQTDLALRCLEGAEVVQRPDHLIVRTPSNPGFRWGNFVLVSARLATQQADGWFERFEAAFPGAHYVAIGIDDPDAQLAAIPNRAPAGLRPEVCTVLAASALSEPEPGPDAIEYRPLESEHDWEAEARLSEAVETSQERGAREFVQRRQAAIRGVCERGHGAWFGAFRDGEMLAGLGIFDAGRGNARFQAVDTHPAYRRLGLARNLLYASAQHGLSRLGARRLVIAADPEYFAIEIYRALGFRDHERQLQFEYVPAA